jgi:hypothetical protein
MTDGYTNWNVCTVTTDHVVQLRQAAGNGLCPMSRPCDVRRKIHVMEWSRRSDERWGPWGRVSSGRRLLTLSQSEQVWAAVWTGPVSTCNSINGHGVEPQRKLSGGFGDDERAWQRRLAVKEDKILAEGSEGGGL